MIIDNSKIWDKIETNTQKFISLGLNEAIDYQKFYLYSIITHSTAIEGSSLSEKDTTLLFDEGITSGNKPLIHFLMNQDLKNAYQFAIDEAFKKTIITPQLLTNKKIIDISKKTITFAKKITIWKKL